jgi:hypothetical protein
MIQTSRLSPNSENPFQAEHLQTKDSTLRNGEQLLEQLTSKLETLTESVGNDDKLIIFDILNLNASFSEEKPNRQQKFIVVELGGGRYSKDDRATRSAGVHPIAYKLVSAYLGNDSANIDRIIERPQQIDQNIWKYEHIRQFVLELNLLATSLKDICNK